MLPVTVSVPNSCMGTDTDQAAFAYCGSSRQDCPLNLLRIREDGRQFRAVQLFIRLVLMNCCQFDETQPDTSPPGARDVKLLCAVTLVTKFPTPTLEMIDDESRNIHTLPYQSWGNFEYPITKRVARCAVGGLPEFVRRYVEFE